MALKTNVAAMEMGSHLSSVANSSLMCIHSKYKSCYKDVYLQFYIFTEIFSLVNINVISRLSK